MMTQHETPIPESKYPPLTDQQLRRSIYIAILLTILLPPFVGGSIMGLVGFYPLPEFYLIFFSYSGPYVLAVLLPGLALAPRAYRFITNLPQLEHTEASSTAQRVFSRLPWYLLGSVTLYSIGGALSADYSLESMGVRDYSLREHLYNQFGLIPVVLITVFPIFFFFIDRLGLYLGPRGISIIAIPLWMKMLMLGIVTPLLIDSLLIGYYYNRTGYFQWETLGLWLSLLILAAGGTWLAWRSLRQGLMPIEMFLAARDGSLSERASANLKPLSLDELGVFTARTGELLSTQQQLSTDLQHTQFLADSVIESAGALVVVLDKDGRIIRFNQACEKLSGFSFAEVEGEFPWETVLPPEDAESIRENAFETLAHNPQAMSGRFTNYWLTKAGERALIEWVNSVLVNDQGRMEHMISVGTDITQRKHEEEALEQSEARLNEAQRIAKVGSWELDLANNHLIWSDEIFNIFEIDKIQFGASYEAFLNGIHPDDRDRVNQTYTDSLDNRQPYEIAHRLQMNDGRIKYVRESCKSFFDDDGKPLRSVGTVQDISELHQVEEELRRHRDHLEEVVLERTAEMREAQNKAERANAAKSEFLSRMSHELRTPLNAVLGFGQLLEMDAESKLNESQAENVTAILTAGNHLLELVNEVLDLSRIENGQLEVSMKPIALTPVIEACIAQLAPLAEARSISTKMESKADCTIMADPMRLKEVLLNLLSNAIKYNSEGGSIQLSCTPIGDDRLRISVQDTGRGISTDALPRLFRPFERMESAYDGIEGAGIGLALSKKLVNAMHGDIGVESIPGEGSTFWFELPLVAKTSKAATTSGNGRHKILYIEDNLSNLRLVKSIVATHTDIELLDALCAEDGLKIAEDQHPDLILLDINLPGMDGFEALKQLQTNPLTCDIPVVAVTANAMTNDVEHGEAAGFVEYLTKPIDIPRFLNLLDQYLPNNVGDKHE